MGADTLHIKVDLLCFSLRGRGPCATTVLTSLGDITNARRIRPPVALVSSVRCRVYPLCYGVLGQQTESSGQQQTQQTDSQGQ